LHDNSRRIMYINDPELYFQSFKEIEKDIAYFLGTDYLVNPDLRKKLENALKFGNVDTATKFMYEIMEYYIDSNIRCDIVIDQYNNLESNREKDAKVYQFFTNLIRMFRDHVVLSASNENETLRKFTAEEIKLFPGKFLKNNDEALDYLEYLKYFEAIFKNQTPANKLMIVQQIKTITNFNPFEMMKLI